MQKLNTVIATKELFERQAHVIRALDAKPTELDVLPITTIRYSVPETETHLTFCGPTSSDHFLILRDKLGMRMSFSDLLVTEEEAACVSIELYLNPDQKYPPRIFWMAYMTKPNLGTFRHIGLGSPTESIELASVLECHNILERISMCAEAVKKAFEERATGPL